MPKKFVLLSFARLGKVTALSSPRTSTGLVDYGGPESPPVGKSCTTDRLLIRGNTGVL